jgi:hypothetical protein
MFIVKGWRSIQLSESYLTCVSFDELSPSTAYLHGTQIVPVMEGLVFGTVIWIPYPAHGDLGVGRTSGPKMDAVILNEEVVLFLFCAKRADECVMGGVKLVEVAA